MGGTDTESRHAAGSGVAVRRPLRRLADRYTIYSVDNPTSPSTVHPRYLYHRVPEPLRGTTLYPLNQLRAIYPDLAAAHAAKYVGREALCERRIPRLDCGWNDVLMLSPVQPTKLRAALRAAGFDRFPAQWFAVDVALLEPEATVIYLPPEEPPADFVMREDDVVAFDPCGYCHSPEVVLGMPLEVEHLYPVALGGSSMLENLWLACSRCNDFKGDRIEAVVPGTDQLAAFYNPRQQAWTDHFAWSPDGTEIVGQSQVGQATMVALRLNNEYIVATRRVWVAAGWWPPADDFQPPTNE